MSALVKEVQGQLSTLYLGQPAPHDILAQDKHDGSLASGTQAGRSQLSDRSGNSLQTINYPRSSTTKRLRAIQPTGCIIRGIASCTDEGAHFVDAVRGKDKGPMKHAVEALLVALGLVNDGFKLDSLQNIVRMGCELHRQWDNYGLFALAPPDDRLDVIIQLLEWENSKWEQDPHHVRWLPKTTSNLNFLPLYPDKIVTSPGTFVAFMPPQLAHRSLQYFAVDHGELVGDTGGPVLSILLAPRYSNDINPLLVVIKAHTVLSRMAALHPDLVRQLPTRIIHTAAKVFRVYELMFWTPEAFELPDAVLQAFPPSSPSQGRRRCVGAPRDGGDIFTNESAVRPQPRFSPIEVDMEDSELEEDDDDEERFSDSSDEAPDPADVANLRRLHSEFNASTDQNERRNILTALLGQDTIGSHITPEDYEDMRQGRRPMVSSQDPAALFSALAAERQAAMD